MYNRVGRRRGIVAFIFFSLRFIMCSNVTFISKNYVHWCIHFFPLVHTFFSPGKKDAVKKYDKKKLIFGSFEVLILTCFIFMF